MRLQYPPPGLSFALVTLSPAQIQALLTTPVNLVSAPGTGRALVPFGFALVYNFGTHAYDTQTVPGPVPIYAGTPGTALTIDAGQALTASSSTFTWGYGTRNTLSFVQSAVVNKAIQLTDNANYNAGPILTATLGAGGTGYAVNDTGTIQQNNNDATYKVLTVGAGGAVLTFQITGNGTQYVTANGVATATGGAQPGVGTGFTVNITAVTLGDGTLKVVTYYQVLSVP